MCSTRVFIEVTSIKNMIDSTVFCHLINQATGDLLTNIIKPLWDILVTILDACYASKNTIDVTFLPLG